MPQPETGGPLAVHTFVLQPGIHSAGLHPSPWWGDRTERSSKACQGEGLLLVDPLCGWQGAVPRWESRITEDTESFSFFEKTQIL